ncbi:MAG: PH domain-containing protein, partial [Oscillospiraceae bacterium]
SGLEGGILILITFLYIPFLYVNTLFYINDTAIILHKGVIFPSTQILYRDRIAFVTIYKNPLTPLLHVSTLRITAAGGNMTILFLNSVRAKKLSQELLKDIEDDIEINN